MGIKVEYLGDGEWRLLESIFFLDITVPAGFIYDGTSAPRFLWGILPPMQDTAEAAAIHDWMCKEAKGKEGRKRADRYFTAALLTRSNVNLTRCILGYIGVRLGAWWGVGVPYRHWRDRWKK